MEREKKITLGGVNYTVQPFTIDQLEEVSELLGGGSINGATSMKILKIALRNADPVISDPGTVRANLKEISAATEAVLELSGVDVQKNPPEAALPAA